MSAVDDPKAERKKDRRVRYTEMVLKDSLIALLHRQPISGVSVKAICDAADINRSTFYAHYSDPGDLLRKIEADVIRDMEAYLAPAPTGTDVGDFTRMLVKIFDYIVENRSLCVVLLGENGGADFKRDIMDMVQSKLLLSFRERKGMDAETVSYLMIYTVNGSIGVIQEWLNTGMDKKPAEMAEIIVKLVHKGFTAFA